MGTRFIASAECPAHSDYKSALVDATEEDTLVVRRSARRVSRLLATPFARRLWARQQEGAAFAEIQPYLDGERNRMAALEGNFEAGPLYAGQSLSLITSVLSVREIIESVAIAASPSESGSPRLSS
jgi:NAD(P)H-dependent flavin oxidoreductase YrpB (nitropropane dioxygenase family)